MPLRNARQDISTWSKFKPSIAIMKEKSTKISHSVTTGSDLNHKECLKLQNKSYISIQKLYSKTEKIYLKAKIIFQDRNYIPRQKLYCKTKGFVPVQKLSEFRSRSADASQDLLSREFLRTSSFQLPKTMNLPYWWNEKTCSLKTWNFLSYL